MSKNAQILLENLIEQEFQNNDNYSSISLIYIITHPLNAFPNIS